MAENSIAQINRTPDGFDVGHTVTLPNGTVLTRTVNRDPYRRHLVTAVTNSFGLNIVSDYNFSYDLLDRVTGRNADTFGYNVRSEVTSATIQPDNNNRYEYDNIGNNLWTSLNSATNIYTANTLNQYTSILCAPAPLREPSYDLDGNLLTNGVWSYTLDAENRMTGAASNGVPVVTSGYDPQHRRVVKTTPSGRRIFLYDGWLPVLEEFIRADGTNEVREHVWGKDLSGTMQGAGGVGGLLATRIGGAWYFPLYDMNGNVTDYISESGANVAHRVYDAFGNTTAKSGPMADDFNFWFSTKYLDHETGLYYYGRRFYAPWLGRWLNRDPIQEQGGLNLYGFVGNNGVGKIDPLGLYEKVALGAGIGFSVSFGGQGKPQFSAMLVGSLKQSPCENLRFNADVGIRLLRGGAIGETRNSTDWTYEVFGAISGSIGKSNGRSVPFYFNGMQWGSALGDTYGSSLSVGQTLYYNSALNETPRMGLIRLQSGGAFFNQPRSRIL